MILISGQSPHAPTLVPLLPHSCAFPSPLWCSQGQSQNPALGWGQWGEPWEKQSNLGQPDN